MKYDEKKIIIFIFILALILRIAVVLLADGGGLSYDQKQYDRIATNLISGEGFAWYEGITTTFRPPLYPFFMATLYLLFGKSYLVIRITQAILGSLLPIITYMICKKIFNMKIAKISALIITIHVPFILYTVALITENIFLPLFGLSVFFILKSLEEPKYYILVGIFLGLTILTRPSISAFIPILFLWFYYHKKNIKLTIRNFAIIMMFILILITPWIIRNYIVTDQFVFIDTRAGYNLYMGYNPNATGTFNFESTRVINKIKNDIERNNWGKENAIKYIKQNPLKSTILVFKKFYYFWDLDKREFIMAYSHNYIGELHPAILFFLFFLITIPYTIIIIMGIIGTIFTKLNNKIWLLLIIIFYYTVLHSLTLAESRMHTALIPFITILASKGLTNISKIKLNLLSNNIKLRNKTIKKLIISIIIIIIFIFMWSYGILTDLTRFNIIFSPGGNTAYLKY